MNPSLSRRACAVRKPPSDPLQSDTGTGNQDHVAHTAYVISD